MRSWSSAASRGTASRSAGNSVDDDAMATGTPTVERSARTALVLSGGGARGAYQAGVLQGLVEIGCLARERSNVGLLVGSSAGAINVGVLGATADCCEDGIARLVTLWCGLSADQVFRTDVLSLGSIGLR